MSRLKSYHLAVNDVIETPGPHRYEVQGIHGFGPASQDSVVELAGIGEATASEGRQRSGLMVPKEMLDAGLSSGLFSLVN